MKKLVYIILTIIIVMIISVLSYRFTLSSQGKLESNSSKIEEKAFSKNLVVAPQVPEGKVIVESAILEKNGFLVVRLMDDGKLSQVVEMSRPLQAGTHNNIPINIENADIKGKELIVMTYEDYDNDQVFNDLDMPVIDENGFMTARYVATGKPLPSTITEAEDPNKMVMPGMKVMAKVRYTDTGFVPNKIEIKVGDMVEFVNESNKDMWVASMSHPAHAILPTFDQFRAYKKGAIYRYIFDKKGTWEFHDHINPTRGGVINVID